MRCALLCAAFVLALTVGAAAEDKSAKDKKITETTITGVIKKVDPSAHRLHVSVKDLKTPSLDREFEITKTTKFIFGTGDDKKEAVGVDAYKNEQLKEGAEVVVVTDGKDKATEVRVGKALKPKNP